MRLSIKKREKLIWNTIIFSIFSLVFLYTAECLIRDVSALRLDNFIVFLKNYKFTSILLIVVLYQVYFIKSLSKYIIALFLLIILGKSTSFLFVKFDKVLLMLVFTYSILAYYFFSFWKEEIQEPYYCPMFDQFDLSERINYKIYCSVTNNKNHQQKGHLTNWNSKGCYIQLDPHGHPLDVKKNKKIFNGPLTITLAFHDRTFSQDARLISTYNNGAAIGVKFIDNKKPIINTFGWYDFYMILCDRGYMIKYLQ